MLTSNALKSQNVLCSRTETNLTDRCITVGELDLASVLCTTTARIIPRSLQYKTVLQYLNSCLNITPTLAFEQTLVMLLW